VELDWDAANLGHIARHRVTPGEVEQVFANAPMIVGTQEHPEEERCLCFGRTNLGRFLTVVYTERKGKIRVVTVYRMTRAQQRMYLTGRW
jgi:hypothetical protein